MVTGVCYETTHLVGGAGVDGLCGGLDNRADELLGEELTDGAAGNRAIDLVHGGR